MTLAEYYGFPEGTNCMRRYYSVLDDGAEYPIDGDLNKFFYGQPRFALPDMKCKVTSLNNFAYQTNLSSLAGLEEMDTSECTDMQSAFGGSTYLCSVEPIKYWDTSKVTNMNNMFTSTYIYNFDVEWDTSNVTDMGAMLYYNVLQSLCALNCSSVGQNKYPLQNYSNQTALTTVGGFIDMKSSWDNNYGLAKTPNLTYESCINILNGLYDFTGNSQTPTSTQGKLKVHQNFLNLVGDEISIGTNKGWTITT